MSESDSDDAPSSISFKQSRNEFENFDNDVKDFLKERRQALKSKRRIKEETLKKQKSGKKQKQSSKTEDTTKQDVELADQRDNRFLPASVLNALKDEDGANDLNSELKVDADQEPVKSSTRVKVLDSKKEYKKLNIKVEALNHLNQQRVDSALAFRNKKLSKVHRENVKINTVHQLKLAVSGQDLPKGKLYL